ncbi:hypothetical protein PRZ48_012747 [Zasmidium cellare]|uniref:Uncharacterized protein n=1 Tax=Zasmidium cellare TaxID=395010 RepID=A0ABR0E5S3_ZASCE|nr:hypothetical protein PRZ48_012747 [Zasmidium cellare]
MSECLLTRLGSILKYPTPTLIAWNQTFNTDYLLAGGSHKAKIIETLKYLEAMDPSQDDDLVMMMDAYGAFPVTLLKGPKRSPLPDIWFQLRPETMISRYYSINAAANKRLKARLGKAYEKESLRQTIIFGAGKRCAPNQMHTAACYPVPASPLPDDLYGNNTDSELGKNPFTTAKQRYLNSGFIMGPIADIRRMFKRAWEIVETRPGFLDPWDNGSHGSDFTYHASDQAIFAIMFGNQEYQREVMRQRHLTSYDKMRGKAKSQPLKVGPVVVNDVLNPPFTHEPIEPKEGQPDEFGIGLDYFSDLIHQTINAEDDAHYLTFHSNITGQLSDRTGHFDCPSRVNGSLPQDILSTTPPLADLLDEDMPWDHASLYTNVCYDTVPVMIHHNGDKPAREKQWSKTWMQPYGKRLLEGLRGDGAGAFLPSMERLGWEELCPKEYEWELFREGEKPGEKKGE